MGWDLFEDVHISSLAAPPYLSVHLGGVKVVIGKLSPSVTVKAIHTNTLLGVVEGLVEVPTWLVQL